MNKLDELNSFSLDQLKTIAENLKIKVPTPTDKQALIYTILNEQALMQAPPLPKDAPKEAKPQRTARAPKQSTNSKRAPAPAKKAAKNEGPSTPSATPAPPPPAQTDKEAYSLQDFPTAITGEGVLEIIGRHGYLRSADYNYLPSPDDIYLSQEQLQAAGLKNGDTVVGKLRPPKERDSHFGLAEIISINGHPPAALKGRPNFDHLEACHPTEKFNLSHRPNEYATRIMDLFVPIGKGQRGLIVAPPKVGKTTLLKNIAHGIAHNHPDVYMIVLLIDERPEEVTDMRRSVQAEVIASTFDERPENHVKIANLVLEKAKNMVACGQDVVIILDSLTRLARAYNAVAPSSGRILSGGVDSNALRVPKRFFGAARKLDGGASLTIIASALVDTGSRMDEVIFEEFKGTGNMELILNRPLANKGIYPAVDILRSSTRKVEELQHPEVQKKVNIIRRVLADMNTEEATNLVLKRMKNKETNEQFLVSVSTDDN